MSIEEKIRTRAEIAASYIDGLMLDNPYREEVKIGISKPPRHLSQIEFMSEVGKLAAKETLFHDRLAYNHVASVEATSQGVISDLPGYTRRLGSTLVFTRT